MLQMCPSSERVSKVCTPHTVDTREMAERATGTHTDSDAAKSAAYNQHDEVMRIVNRQQMLLEEMSTKLNDLKESQRTSLEEPKESSETYV